VNFDEKLEKAYLKEDIKLIVITDIYFAFKPFSNSLKVSAIILCKHDNTLLLILLLLREFV